MLWPNLKCNKIYKREEKKIKMKKIDLNFYLFLIKNN